MERDLCLNACAPNLIRTSHPKEYDLQLRNPNASVFFRNEAHGSNAFGRNNFAYLIVAFFCFLNLILKRGGFRPKSPISSVLGLLHLNLVSDPETPRQAMDDMRTKERESHAKELEATEGLDKLTTEHAALTTQAKSLEKDNAKVAPPTPPSKSQPRVVWPDGPCHLHHPTPCHPTP